MSLILTAFSNNAFAIIGDRANFKDEKKRIYATFAQATAKTVHQARIIKNIAEHGSIDQLKEYIEKLNNDELNNVYHYIFKTFGGRCSEKFETAKKLIANAHSERTIADVIEKMRKHGLKSKGVRIKFSKPIMYFPKKSAGSSKKTKQKSPTVQVKTHVCSSCRKQVPIGRKSTLVKCKNCGHEEKGYLCKECLSAINPQEECTVCKH